MANGPFTRKPLELLLEEAKGKSCLRCAIGPIQFTDLSFFRRMISGQTGKGGEPIGMLAGSELLLMPSRPRVTLAMARDAESPFRVPLSPIIPLLGIFTCLMLVFALPATNWWRLGLWLALGLVIYFAYGRRHSVMNDIRMMESATPAR